MSRSLIYMVNNTQQTLAVGSTISFGLVNRHFGCNCISAGTTPAVRGAGYYSIDANFVFAAATAGAATITLYKDGVAIPGAQMTLTVAPDIIHSVTIPAVIKEKCCESFSPITAVITGVGATVSLATIEVVKE